MLITVSICTRNRAATLRNTLASIERARPVDCDWELLVTDNGSSDDTLAVVDSYAGRLPIRWQVEKTPGVAHARNAAARAAKGEYLVTTDDDTLVDHDWLAAYVNAFRAYPDTDLFGGRIIPVFEEPKVPWFERVASHFGGPLAIRDLGDRPVVLPVEMDYVPYGANCAVRTRVQRLFPFDTRRGPGQTYLGEETTSFFAMMRAGHQARWVPASRVDHLISAHRQSVAYIRWWYELLGRTLIWDGQDQYEGIMWFGAPRWLWRRAVTRELKLRLAQATRQPAETWALQLINVSLDWGRLREFRSAAAEHRRGTLLG